MIEFYYRRPIFWDYIFAFIIAFCLYKLYHYGNFSLPADGNILSMVSDLGTISLTLSGFILTLLTILITFKADANTTQDSNISNANVFELFFASELYFITVKHFKNAVKSLVVVAVIGYTSKLFLKEKQYEYLFYFNISGLFIVIVTVWRSLVILSKVIKMQRGNLDNN